MSGDGWTFDDLARLKTEAVLNGDHELFSRICVSDNFEPNLAYSGGIKDLIITTREEKAAERKRVDALYAERRAIKERWAREANPLDGTRLWDKS